MMTVTKQDKEKLKKIENLRKVQIESINKLLLIPMKDNIRIAQDVRAGKLPMEHFIKHSVKLNDRLEKIWEKAK